MGIDIPPPKGGPVVFTASSPGDRSPGGLSPDEERLRTPDLRDDFNDSGSISLSEGETANAACLPQRCLFERFLNMPSRLDGTVDSQHRDGEDADMPAAPLLANNVVRHYFSNGPTLSLCEYLGIVSGVVAICTKRGFSYSKLILLPFNIRCNPPSFFFYSKKKEEAN